MQENLQRKPRLAIISDTAMYLKDNIYIFEPVLREVRFFAELFCQINWLGFIHRILPPLNAKKEIPDNLKLVTVNPCGGNTYIKKIGIIFFIPYYVFKIIRLVKKSEIIHTRGPSIPALLTILISFLYPQKKYWHKYAGNWQIRSKTLTYKLQRWLLMKKVPGKVTVSQRNNSDPPHILSFVNPCLTNEEIKANKKSGLNKNFDGKLTFCFIGRVDASKGFPALLDAIIDMNDISWIDKLHCAGTGSEREKFEIIASKYNLPIIFHGLLDRYELNKLYNSSHFIILPSQSEGFPKVLAEASSFGCIPIVPKISSIISLINENKKNGIILSDIEPQGIKKTIKTLLDKRNELSMYSANAMMNAKQFTYENYNQCIVDYILSDTE